LHSPCFELRFSASFRQGTNGYLHRAAGLDAAIRVAGPSANWLGRKSVPLTDLPAEQKPFIVRQIARVPLSGFADARMEDLWVRIFVELSDLPP
jgi:hypothetical protein